MSNEKEELVLMEVKDRIAYLTLNAPESLNAFSMEMRACLLNALVQCEENDEVRGIIITGAGRAFCAGGDIKTMNAPATVMQKRNRVKWTGKIALAIRAMEKPVIAAINGHAVGAGTTLALACDVVVSVQRAKFGVSFIKMGLIPDLGCTYLLPQAVGLSKAKELALTGRMLSASEAQQLGIVNYISDDEHLMETATNLMKDIITWPKAAVGMTKRMMNQAVDKSWPEALDAESNAQGLLLCTEQNQEAITAFLEKHPRAIPWTGSLSS